MIALGLAASMSLAQNRLETDAPKVELLRTQGGYGSLSVRGERVRVRLETDSPKVELFRVTGEGVGTVATGRGVAAVGILEYSRECVAPCDTFISEPRADFFIAGSGIPASERFSLMGRGEDITLRVKPGSSALKFLGWTSTTLGLSTLAVAGVIILLEGLDSGSGAPTLGSSSKDLSTLKWATLGGGAALVGAGIPLIAFSGTDVEFLPGKPAAAPVGQETL
ncbi:hypothetical protein [Vitiosangium sp. GDMCC 1.1324]|uniref:hypothetical protein n=1 Tax=Vitiosangium sp. (strain GDMCC 1.1324) TaxID=2138576 RepID=UPI0011B800BB|nr:hypothetical protein [Vitiosangium sp. GDMCC 1.1324]